jgi:hypothetical protein
MQNFVDLSSDQTINGNKSFGSAINTNTQYNIGGSRVLSIGGTNNVFVGAGAGQDNMAPDGAFFGAFAGQANTVGLRNSFFGSNSARVNTNGGDNAFFGFGTGQSNTNGSNDAFFGAFAGQNNTTGQYNNFVGSNAGISNTTGSNNAFFGAAAGRKNVTGSNNAFFGYLAGEQTTVGDNAFFGGSAGEANTTGIKNSFFGSSAGLSNTTENNNTFIGAFSNGVPGITNATAIGADAVVAQSNSIVLGNNASVGIGTTAPQAKLHVANPGGTAGQFDGDVTINGNFTVNGSTNISSNVNHDSTLSGNGTTGSPLAVVSAPNGVVTTGSYANPSWITSLDGNKLTAGTVVKSFNGLADSVTLAAGSNVTITPSGNTLTIAATAPEQKVNPHQIALLRWYEARSDISFPIGVDPQEMAFDGSNLWVINGGSNSVTKFSANDGTVLGTYAVGAGPNEILFDGANIWVANIVGSVTKLRAADGALVGTYPVDKPTGLTFDGTFIWVANNNSGELTKIKASDGSTSLGKGMNGNPYKIVFDGGSYWYTLPFHGGVCRFNPVTGDSCLDLGPNTQGLAFDGANIWVAVYGDNSVKKIRVSDRTVVGTYAVGSGPLRVVFDGVNIWVSNTVSNTVTKLRASDGANLGNFPTGSGPVGIVFDGANVWVSNSSGNTISKF